MTTLDKTVRRESCRSFEAGRPVIVTLEPGDIIGFRLKGTRTTFKTTIMACYHLSVKQAVEAQRREKINKKRLVRR